MNDMPSLLPVGRLAPGEVLSFLPSAADLLPKPASGPFQFFEIEHGNLVIIGRGHTVDLAAQLTIENARDWRPVMNVPGRYSASLPQPMRGLSRHPDYRGR